MKTCTRCNEDKDVDEFQIRKASKDGYSSACKECLSRYDKSRTNLSHRVKAREEYSKTENYRVSHNKASRKYDKSGPGKLTKKRWIEDNKHKKKAHGIVAYKIKTGELAKGFCEVCGEKKAEAHHDDYSKPLEVRWLCRKHHAEHHKKLRQI